MSDPGLPFKCPRCGEPLVYVATTTGPDGAVLSAGETHVYTCASHGEYRYTADGYLRGGTGPYGRKAAAAKRRH